MQFHLNGFKAGDPEISEPAERYDGPRSSGHLPAEVDVLIIGCGPAGLTLGGAAGSLSGHRHPDRRAEVRSAAARPGRRDRLAARWRCSRPSASASVVLKEAYWVNEVTFWKPDDKRRRNIVRSGRVQDAEDGLSEFPHVILNQARVHDFYLQVMRNAPNRLEPDYARRLIDLQIDPCYLLRRQHAPTYPVTVRLERDRSRARRPDRNREGPLRGGLRRRAQRRAPQSLGRALHGDSANQAWGVMDVLAVTDFPDIRLKAAIQSANEGNILIIPREGGYLVRIYVELDKLKEDETDRESQHHRRSCDRRGAANPASLHPRGEGGRMVVGLRDRPAALRQVRRRAGGRGRNALSARLHRRRRLPYAQPEGWAGHERLHAGQLQSGMETGGRPPGAVLAAVPAYLFSGTPGRRRRS